PVPWGNGPWFFSVVREGPLVSNLTYAIRVTPSLTEPPLIVPLSNAVPFLAGAPALGTNYYQFTVSPGAVQADFELFALSGNADLYVRPGSSLPGPGNAAYAGTRPGTNAEFIAVARGGSPVALAPGDWFLAVVNREAAGVTYQVQATEFVPGTPTLVRLTNGVAHPHAIITPGATVGDGIDYYVYEVGTNAAWAAFDVLAPSANVDLLLRRALPLPTPVAFDYLGANLDTNDEQILLTPGSAPVPLAPGDWYLGVAWSGLATDHLNYAVRASEFTNAPPVFIALTNAADGVVALGSGESGCFRFPVSPGALQANFELRHLSGDVDLFVKPGLPVPGEGLHAYASTNGGTNAEFIAVATNSVPTPLVAGDWYLTVVNREAAPVIATVRATEFVLGSSQLPLLAMGQIVARTNLAGAGVFEDRIDYYAVNPGGLPAVRFEIQHPNANLDLLVRGSLTLPRPGQFDYRNANPGTEGEEVLVTRTSTPVALAPGLWFFGVAHDPAIAHDVTYAVQVRPVIPPPLLVTLTNGIAFATNVAAPGTNAYRFVMPPNVVQANFEVLSPSDDVDLFVRPWLPLPDQVLHHYAGTNTGAANEFIAVAASPSVTPAPADWYLSVVNRSPVPVTYAVLVSAYPPVTELTNALPFGAALGTGAGPVPDGIDYYLYRVSANAAWATFEVVQPTADVTLLVTRGLPFPQPGHFDFRSAAPGTGDEYVLVVTNTLPVALAPGDWYLGVTRGGLAVSNLTYAVLATEYSSAPPVIVTLTNGVPFSNSVVAAGTQYYRFQVATGAVQANLELHSLTGDADLFVKPGLPLPDPARFAYAATHAGTQSECIVLTPGSLPAPLTPGDWHLAVVNRAGGPVDYAIQASAFVPGTPALRRLTNGVPLVQTLDPVSFPFHGGTDYFVFEVPVGAVWATFDVLQPTAGVDLVLRRNLPLPTAADHDYRSAHHGTLDEGLLVLTNSSPVPLAPGDWYLGVVHGQPLTNAVSYVVTATAHATAPPIAADLTNAVPFTNAAPGFGTNYYRFRVSSNAVQANFELRHLTGNADLFVKPDLPLPHPARFAYAGTNEGTASEWIAVIPDAGPAPLAPGDWHLAVVIRDAAPVSYAVVVTEFVEGVLLGRLTNGVAFTNTATALPSLATDYYALTVSSNKVRAQFEIIDPESDVTLVLRRGLPLPTLAQFDYRSANPSTNQEWLVVYDTSAPVPLSEGAWYVGVVKLETNRVRYTVRFTEFDQFGTNLVITRISPSAISLCIAWTNAVPGVVYHLEGAPLLAAKPAWSAVSPALTATAPDMEWCLPWPTPYRFFQVAEGFPISSNVLPTAAELRLLPVGAGGVLFQWTAMPGLSFSVEWASNVTGPWQEFSAPLILFTNGAYRFTDDHSETGSPSPTRFYRVRPRE
ncbi:MAG: hypothetical protein JXQ71_01265, partial [Verrucomicrobia bacterium]|nr:hypothetical protein [Verrucomicrobiota bacterium]